MIHKYEIDILKTKHYPHFSQRLFERYGIKITFAQYQKLCKINKLGNEQPANNPKNGLRGKTGTIEINGVKVKVFKGVGGIKPLITALCNK